MFLSSSLDGYPTTNQQNNEFRMIRALLLYFLLRKPQNMNEKGVKSNDVCSSRVFFVRNVMRTHQYPVDFFTKPTYEVVYTSFMYSVDFYVKLVADFGQQPL